ncbi:alpha/beta fold hydrolase [Nonomuraea typhae]|uniref:alpha/beta fold hydrolase n=1 Tax=Nonomuraea typhae TaxID=2603600 RepID=UPI001C667CC8|nr:alpha/beta fold hydrolase [Nonomuraea typhae]
MPKIYKSKIYMPNLRLSRTTPARLAAGALCLALASSVLTAVPARADAAPGRADAAPARADASLTWGACRDRALREAGAQCAKVSVPLDYADPAGRTIQIAISRVKATGPRRGVLLSNPGGPGGTGLAFTLGLRATLKDVAGRYDLIGFDPRFLGESTPISCGPARARPATPARTTPRADFEATLRASRETARRCLEHGDNRDLLPHASTRNVARDMDAIRAALGERKLSFFGVSYGADLGAVFTQLFPGSVDRMVIDSSSDPGATQYELFQQAGAPLEAALDDWARWAAARHGRFGLGRTGAKVRAVVQRVLDRAEYRPPSVGGARLDAGTVRLLLRQLVQHREQDVALAEVVRDLAAGPRAEPSPSLKAMIRLLRSDELARSMEGAVLYMCGDAGWPAGGWPQEPGTYWRNMTRGRAAQPVFGPLVNGMMAPCAYWDAERPEPVTAIRNRVPVLMLQAASDNLAGARVLHRRLAGSRLVTAEIRAHGVYGRGAEGGTPVPCADRAVNAYLAGGRLPSRDFTCPGA